MAKLVTIMAYETSDGRNYIGKQFSIDEKLKICKLKEGCVIHSTNFPQNKSYEEAIKELYPKAQKRDIQFSLEKVVRPPCTVKLILEK